MYLSKRKVILVTSISALVFFFTYTDIKSQDIKITDGDTIKLNGDKIRFSGIDTPELKQTCVKNDVKILCGLNAKKILVDKIGNNQVICVREGKDHYKRVLAECFVNNESLSIYMVKNGYAFDYVKYSKKKYQEYENFAKKNKLGLWKTKFEYPWVWRKKNR